ncbi:MAG: polyprenol phosphomannose-dependent alpha 1,6 mannosyltransferase MptB [Sporichthyaceae bacterium]
MLTAGLLGPSVAQPPLGPRRPHPPYSLFLGPDPWLVSGLIAAAIVLGAAAVATGLLALRRGWVPDPRRLFAAAGVAVGVLMLVAPMGSGDHLSYAAYGRIVVAGDNPYAESPQRWREGTDPVAGAVEPPWRWAPSVYGPVATAEQGLASLIGGSSLHTTVFVLMLMNAVAFLGTGLMLHRLLRGDRSRQVRAALLWSLNPLLLYQLVVGAHLDTVAVALGVAGVAVLRRRTTGATLAAGALVGAAVAVKLPLALFGVGLVWVLRREPRRVLALAVGALVLLVPSYLAAGPHVFDQLRRAATYVSLATPWRMVLGPLTAGFGRDGGRQIITALAAFIAVLLAAVLLRALPRTDGDKPDLEAARVACVLTVAWVLAAPYALPWYDALVWAPLALLPASRLDLLLLARTSVLALAYVPGRTVTLLPDDLRRVTLGFRADVAPWLVLALVLSVLALAAGRRLQPRPAPAL